MAKNTLMHTQNFMIKFFRFNINHETFIQLKNKFRIKTWLVAGFSALSMLYACSDDGNSAGLEIHPPNDNISLLIHSSNDLKAFTYESENKIFISTSHSNVLLGLCNDPILGQFQNNFITKVGIAPSNDIYDTVIVEVDSLILYLNFNSSDGDTTEIQDINIYELELDSDITDLNGVELYSHTLNGYYNPKVLKTFPLQPRKSWYNDNVNRSPIRVDLSKEQELIDRLLIREIAINEDSSIYPYQNLTLFNEHILNGFYFEAVKNDKSGSVASLSKDSTRMVMYYRVIGDTKTDTTSFIYDIASQPKANIFYRTFKEDLTYNKMYTDINRASEDTVIYIKNNNAFYTKIVIDDIGIWTQDSGSINKAAIFLEFSEVIDTNTLFYPIGSLIAHRKVGSELYPLFKHTSSKGIVPIGINFDRTGYEIVITKEVQDMIKERENSITLVIKSAENYSTPRRVILNSPLKDESPMNFTITYTKY